MSGHAEERQCDHRHRCSRRRFMVAGTAAASVAVAGCLSGESTPDPIALAGNRQCDVCGMVIEKHPGPNGQIFYRDNSPEGHDNPAWFDSLKQCLFPYRLEHEATDWSATAVYVTDYSAVEYDLQTEEGTTYISSHTAPESFAPAEELHYVVDSELKGAMGPDFIPFSDRADAESLVAEYGGDIIEYGAIDEGLIGR